VKHIVYRQRETYYIQTTWNILYIQTTWNILYTDNVKHIICRQL